MLVTKTSLDVSVYSCLLSFRFVITNMFRTRTQKSSLFQDPKSLRLAHPIGDATQNIAKKERTLLNKITSLQKYKQEGLNKLEKKAKQTKQQQQK